MAFLFYVLHQAQVQAYGSKAPQVQLTVNSMVAIQ